MISASVDTDILIHLYSSDRQYMLFEFFQDLFIHEFLYDKELKKKIDIYNKVKADVLIGKLKVITTKDLIELGVKKLFETYLWEHRDLFDQGEQYAVSLAKVMGLCALISDDTKDFGPHDTLVKEQIKGVIPLAFYELLFLKYLSGELTLEGLHKEFEHITSQCMKENPMNFYQRLSRTSRRFTHKYGTERDCKWIETYCRSRNIDYKTKMKDLGYYLRKNN